MSEFMDALVDLLPEHNSLKRTDNQLRRVLDLSVGEWFDQHSIQALYDNLFLNSAVGGYLDLHGKDYGVYRQVDESDESFRRRIIFEKLEYLTANNLIEIFGVKLFTFRSDFNVNDNTLVSDNYYIPSDKYIGVGDEEKIKILDNKYVLGDSIYWLNENGDLDYILSISGVNVLNEYSKIYELSSLLLYFRDNTSIGNVKLKLPTATTCTTMFYRCSALTDVDLVLPNTTHCEGMFYSCSALTDVKLNLPNLSSYTQMFYFASNIETIDVTIPTSKVSGFKSYVLSLNLQYLTSFIINGEEVDLS